MNSNKHGTVEQNEEHLTMNIFIYYACKTDLRSESYGMFNRVPECKVFRTWQKNDLRGKVNTGGKGAPVDRGSQARRGKWRRMPGMAGSGHLLPGSGGRSPAVRRRTGAGLLREVGDGGLGRLGFGLVGPKSFS